MPILNVAASFQVPSGPSLSATTKLTIDAYDRIDVVIKPGDADKVVEIQPTAASRVKLLVIKSSLYDDSHLTYAVSDGAGNDSAAVALDGPQMLVGAGAVSIFAIDPPQSLKFSNTFAADPAKEAAIEILVGRDATP